MIESILRATNPTDTLYQVHEVFPDAFLEANNFEFKGRYWGNDSQSFFTYLCESGFEIHVVDNYEVWIERYAKLSKLGNIKTGADLLDLIRLIG